MVGICRLCATLRKADLLTNITDESHEVCQQLRHCCQVAICMEDALPKSVCGECIQTLKVAYTFWSKVHESQEALEALFPATAEATSRKHTALSETLTAVTLEVNRRNPQVLPKVEKVDVEWCMGDDEVVDLEYVSQKSSKKDVGVEYLIEAGADGKVDCFEEAYELDEQNTTQEKLPMPDNTKEVCEFELIEEYVKRTETDNMQLGREKTIEMGAIFQEKRQEQNATAKEDEMEVLLEYCTDEDDIQEEEHFSERTIRDEDNGEEDENESSEPCVEDWSSYNWRCYLCSFMASSLKCLQAHALQVHCMKPDDLQYKCSDCQKICPRYHSFLNHVRLRHHSGLALCCDVCDVYYGDYAELDTHRRFHCAKANDFPKAVLCTDCGKSFLNKSSMQLHARIQHNQTEKSHECNDCAKQFKQVGALRAHQRVHSDVKEYSCELCGHTFRQKANLDVHLYSHISDKPFECNVCKKTFKTSVNLEKHTQVHTDVKQFKCDHCSNLFRTKDAKLSHERTHTGELPFECEYCKKRFRFRSTMLTHLNIHTGRRPYSCEPCNHNFTNWSNYNKHMKRRHPGVTERALPGKRASPITRTKAKTQLKTKLSKPASPSTEKVHVVSYIYNEQDQIVVQAGASDSSTAHDYIEISDKPTDSEIAALNEMYDK